MNRYKIEEYKNKIEGNLSILKGLVNNESLNDAIDLELLAKHNNNILKIKSDILDNLEFLEVAFSRNIFYNYFSTHELSSLMRFSFSMKMHNEYVATLKDLKQYIELNFVGNEITEFVFIIYFRICALISSEN